MLTSWSPGPQGLRVAPAKAAPTRSPRVPSPKYRRLVWRQPNAEPQPHQLRPRRRSGLEPRRRGQWQRRQRLFPLRRHRLPGRQRSGARPATSPTGTHDWEAREFVILPETDPVPHPLLSLSKPLRRGLVRRRLRGRDQRPRRRLPVPRHPRDRRNPGLALGTANHLFHHKHPDSMLTGGRVARLCVDGRNLTGSAPSGFLARDVATNSDVFSFEEGACPGF